MKFKLSPSKPQKPYSLIVDTFMGVTRSVGYDIYDMYETQEIKEGVGCLHV